MAQPTTTKTPKDSASAKAGYAEVLAALQSKRDLQNEIHEVRSAIADAAAESDCLLKEMEDAQRAILALKMRDERSAYEVSKSDITAAEDAAQQASSRFMAAEAKRAKLDERLRALEANLSTSDCGTGLGAVLQHQKALETAGAEVDKIQRLVDAQEAMAKSAEEIEPKVQALTRQREELLADIALGLDRNDDLEKIDAEISRLRNDEANLQKKTMDAAAAAAGLRKRKAEAEAQLSELRGQSPAILEQYLLRYAADLGKDYESQAAAVAQTYLRLTALERMILGLGQRARAGVFAADGDSEAGLPCLTGMAPYADAEGALGAPMQTIYNRATRFFESGHVKRDGRMIENALEAERTRLRDLGIDIPS